MHLEEQKELERHKAGLLMFTELNKQSIEFSMRALRGALVLNGGAVTALAALQKSFSLSVFLLFAWGAFFAVLGSGCGYAANYFLADSWRSYQNPKKEKGSNKAEKQGRHFHRASIVFWLVAMGCFLYALISLSIHWTAQP